MKVNKKLVVIFLSALIGLSVSGGIGGAFAWYQYNSQVTASFIGSSVADTSVLQIGHLDGNSNMVWERDFVHPNQNLIPVTFGQLGIVNEKANSIVGNAYGYPEAGKQVNNNYSSWSVIAPNQGFAQFDIYLRAFNANKAAIARDVYLSDITIDSPAETSENHKLVSEAIRIHLAVDGNDDPNRLISKTAITNENPLNLYGPLDLDADGQNDKIGGYSFNDGRDNEIVYGRNGETQTTTAADALTVSREADGSIATNNAKLICKTKASATQFTKITVTVWIEGWAMLGGAKRGENDSIVMSNLWDPTLSAGFDVNVGMTFDTGKLIGNTSSSSSSSSEESSSSSESTESV